MVVDGLLEIVVQADNETSAAERFARIQPTL
jgi:hypothetical protein